MKTIGSTGEYPDIQMYFPPTMCQQCENPSCVEVCPTGACHMNKEDSCILIDAELCIGCKCCYEACPYKVNNDNPGLASSVNLIAGFKNSDSVLFTDDIERYRDKFRCCFCLDDSEAPGFKKGFVTEYIKEFPISEWKDYNIVIVGPPAMMNFSALECVKCGAAEENIWVSYKRKMSCAVGKCGHCKINETYNAYTFSRPDCGEQSVPVSAENFFAIS